MRPLKQILSVVRHILNVSFDRNYLELSHSKFGTEEIVYAVFHYNTPVSKSQARRCKQVRDLQKNSLNQLILIHVNTFFLGSLTTCPGQVH